MMDFFYPRDLNRDESFERVPSTSTDLSSPISAKIVKKSAQLDHYDYTLATRYGSRKMLNSTFFRGKKRDVLSLGDYAIKKTLGVGSFAKVKLCINLKTSEKVAVKIIEKSNFQSQKLKTAIKREIRLNKLVFHPHIVQVLEMIETDANIFIMMEYIDGGELFNYITQVTHLTEKEARYFFRQVISAIDYLHKSSIVHRDIKPENLLLDSSRTIIKLVDFGLGNTWQKEVKLETFCGSPYYAAPEMIAATPYTGPEVDVWSLGIILYAMVSGHLPFDASCMKQLYNLIITGNYTIPQSFSAELTRLISKMLKVNPAARLTVDEIAKDPWTNIGYNTPVNNYVPHRTEGIINPNKKTVSELVGFGIKESDILHIIKDPNMKHHPVTSLYHLCNETRIRNYEAEFEERRNKMKDHDAPLYQMENYFSKRKFKDKFSASKIALAFKKLLKNPKKDQKFNGIWSAQVLSLKADRSQMDIARKPVPTILDYDNGLSATEPCELKQLQKIPSGAQDKRKMLWIHKKSISDGYQFANPYKITTSIIS